MLRILLASFSAALAAITLFAIVATPIYMFPRSDSVGHVDAVVVLGPPQRARLLYAYDLVERTGADALVISTFPDGRFAANRIQGCDLPQATCFVSDPFTTRGEARYVQGLVDENGWTAVAVVTGTVHVSRARWIFDRCVDVPVAMIDAHTNADWAYQYLYQTAAWVKAVIVGCAD